MTDDQATGTTAAAFPAFAASLQAAWSPALPSLIALHRVGSTNSLVRKVVDAYLVDELLPPALVVAAYTQTAGRGRLGRVWSSPPGSGLWASLLVPAPDPAMLATLPIRVGVALAEGLCGLTGPLGGDGCGERLRLKWPNDLLLDGRKLGGILIEAVQQGGVGVAVVGVGVNLLATPPDQPQAAALRELGGRAPAVEVAPAALGAAVAELLARLAAALGLTEAANVLDADELGARYARWSAHAPGARLRFGTDTGEVAGELLGFAADGRLRLRVDGEERCFASGEVIEA